MALDDFSGDANLSFGDDDDDDGSDDPYGNDSVFGDDFGALGRLSPGKLKKVRSYAAKKQLLKNMRSAQGNATRALRLAAAHPAIARQASRRAMPNYSRALEAARGDDVIFGLDSGSAGIASNVTAALSASPQKRNLPVRITVTQNIANNFVCSDIRVGVEPILATTSNISLAVFQQDSTAPNFRAVVNEVGMDFTMELTNVTGATARFVATVVGVYVPPWARPY